MSVFLTGLSQGREQSQGSGPWTGRALQNLEHAEFGQKLQPLRPPGPQFLLLLPQIGFCHEKIDPLTLLTNSLSGLGSPHAVCTTAPIARMFLTRKNTLRCKVILDARDMNESHPRRPPRFRVPALEEFRRWMGDAKHCRPSVRGAKIFVAKLDLQSAYWSIHLPPAWRRVFVVASHSSRRFRMRVCRSGGVTARRSASDLSWQ